MHVPKKVNFGGGNFDHCKCVDKLLSLIIFVSLSFNCLIDAFFNYLNFHNFPKFSQSVWEVETIILQPPFQPLQEGWGGDRGKYSNTHNFRKIWKFFQSIQNLCKWMLEIFFCALVVDYPEKYAAKRSHEGNFSNLLQILKINQKLFITKDLGKSPQIKSREEKF